MDLWNNVLVKPPFDNDPPFKVNVNAKIFGLVIAILAGLGALGSLLLLPTLLNTNDLYNAACKILNNCQSYGVAVVGTIVSTVGLALSLWGGVRLYQEHLDGKAYIIYGMVAALVGGLLTTIGYTGYGTFVFDVIIYGAVYYFLVISRLPSEPPLVASAPATPSSYPPSNPQVPPSSSPPSSGPPQAPTS